MSDRKVIVFSGHGEDFNLLDEKRISSLPVDDLRKNLEEFMISLKEMLPAVAAPSAGLGLKSVSVALGINAKGQVGFLGTGAEVGGSATLTITFEQH